MTIRQIGAEFDTVTLANASDYTAILQQDSNTGQYTQKKITVENLIAGGASTPNINAGASGTAGTVDIYPTTAAKGKIQIAAADSAGDTTTIITNASQAGARTYTIPDAGASASFVMTAGAQTVAGVKTFTSDITASNADIISATAGKGIQIKEGSNARMGTATLVAGTVTISNTSVTANTRIFINRYDVNSSTALGLLSVGTVTPSTSFVINALKEADATVQTNDVSIVHWMLIEPAA